MEQVISALNQAVNSNAVINTLLVAVFGTLAVRSAAQERAIKELESEKDLLLKTNKGRAGNMGGDP
ncbi:UNVERIFIED_CONTAM: hypothetical protein Sradi_2374300 [Sesamum radiatum]|uniref:Uncharacterized protein n=1 Tax=Sesamum radiatum TaxID=300843 RepID=A0AAW2T6G8_SESRA